MSEPWSQERMVAGIETRTWVDGGGREIPVRELSDEHLAALVEFLASKATDLAFYEDTLDKYMAETEADECESWDPGYLRKKIVQMREWLPWAEIIREEIDRRRVVG